MTKKTTNPNDAIATSATSVMILMHTLKGFRDYIQQHNWTPRPPVGGLNDSDQSKVETGNKLISQGYASAQQHCELATQVADRLDSVVNAAYNYAENFSMVFAGLQQAMQGYKSSPTNELKSAIQELSNNIVEQIDTFQKSTSDAKGSFEALHEALNEDIETMNQGLQSFEGLDGGVVMDINHLSQAQLRKELEQRIESLHKDIHKLELECGFETAGAVGVGLVGGSIALSMCWNPVGWLAGIGTVLGEVFMGLDLKKRYDRLHRDQEELNVSEEEMQLLKPLYCVKNMLHKLTAAASEIDSLSMSLNGAKDDFAALSADVSGDVKHFEGKEYFFLGVDKGEVELKAKDLIRDLGKLRSTDLELRVEPKVAALPKQSTVTA